ncbi:MAG: E2/UBC family protein [Candidatus Zapsychrus exili]|nr:E2/UBC family protein [Candidatus Zapsychrus exili]
MMQGQQNKVIDAFYKDRILTAKKYLKSKFNLSVCDKKDSDIARIEKSRCLPKCFNDFEVWKVKVNTPFGDCFLLIFIPARFPDNFPKIFLPFDIFNRIYPVPHIDKNGFICTRDESLIVINDEMPGQAIEELIHVAIEILDNGINKRNEDDYFKELIAYWNDNADALVMTNFEVLNKPRLLSLFALNDKLFGRTDIIGQSLEYLDNWLKNFNVSIKAEHKERILFIPVKHVLPFDLETFQDVYSYLQKAVDAKLFIHVDDYYNRKQSNYSVICAMEINGSLGLFGWSHPGWMNREVKGFRRGHVPFSVFRHERWIKSIKINRVKMYRLDELRLSAREN